MSLTYHIGYGCFHLEDLLLGEVFCRYDGSLAKVCERQPYRQLNPITKSLLMPDHFMVVIHYGTSNATKVMLHKHALVHAVTQKQARAIGRRLKNRKEKR